MDGDFKRSKRLFTILTVIGASLLLASCSSNKSSPRSPPSSTPPAVPTSSKIRVNWTANPELGVNKAGGGYRVYYSKSSGVDTHSTTYVDVPYVSGATAPTTALLSGLTVGTYYIRVIAYSAYNPLGISGGNRSSDSSEVSITLP